MTSRKLGRRLRSISSRSDGDDNWPGPQGNEGNMIDDLFGVDRNGNERKGEKTDGRNKKKKKTLLDIPDPIMGHIFGYLYEEDLKSLRLVNKQLFLVATDIFRTSHSAIQIGSDAAIFHFKELMDTALNFPFSRFLIIFQHIPRHMLISFTRRYADYIKYLRIEPFDKNGDGGFQQMMDPSQRPLLKLTGMIQELTDVEILDIQFPTMSNFDYRDLQFEKDYRLEKLKVFSVSFCSNGFSRFSSDLTINILQHAEYLDKLKLKLPEPEGSNGFNESMELRRVLITAAMDNVDVAITLIILTNHNSLLDTIRKAMTENGSMIRNLILLIGKTCFEFKGIRQMLVAASDTLKGLVILRKQKRWESKIPHARGDARLHLPFMEHLKFLDVDSYQISIDAINIERQFPELIQLSLHLKYGDDEFYKRSILTPLRKLKLHFHETSIMRVIPPESFMDNLVSMDLIKLELVNPPPGHLTFMSHWGKNIKTLIISAPQDDPTYPLNKILGQLNGVMQFRDDFTNHIGLLFNLRKLSLQFPIDDWTALYLADLPPFWELIVDDSLVSEEVIRRLKYRNNIYISWRPSSN